MIVINNVYGIIYCALNTENNKRYIGQTIRGLDRRKKEHLSQSKNGSKFAIHQAINKYGEEMFEWSIIDVADDQEELDEKELYWINHYDTYGHGGYNMSVGGQFNKRTSENADDVSMMFGGREFYVYDLEGRFVESRYSQTEFAREIGVGVTTVNNILRGLKNSTKGYTLIFKDDYSDEKLESVLEKIYNRQREFVVFDKNNNFIGKWNNQVHCSEEIDMSKRGIQRQLKENTSRERNRKYKIYYVEDVPEYLSNLVTS